MSRIRTMNEAIQEIKEADPRTCLTKSALRRLILTGKIPHTRIGRKILINMDVLERYLNGDTISD